MFPQNNLSRASPHQNSKKSKRWIIFTKYPFNLYLFIIYLSINDLPRTFLETDGSRKSITSSSWPSFSQAPPVVRVRTLCCFHFGLSPSLSSSSESVSRNNSSILQEKWTPLIGWHTFDSAGEHLTIIILRRHQVRLSKHGIPTHAIYWFMSLHVSGFGHRRLVRK